MYNAEQMMYPSVSSSAKNTIKRPMDKMTEYFPFGGLVISDDVGVVVTAFGCLSTWTMSNVPKMTNPRLARRGKKVAPTPTAAKSLMPKLARYIAMPRTIEKTPNPKFLFFMPLPLK